MKYDNFQVVICSDGLPIPEYHTVTEPKLQSCFIPSEIKRRFTVDVTNLSQDRDVEARIYIDGRLLARTAVKSMSHNWASGAQVSHNVVRPFVFSNVLLTDDDEVANPDEPEHGHLGTIQVHLLRIVVHKEQLWEGEMHYDDIGPIHERSKKVGAHQVLLGETEITPSVDFATVSRIDQPNTPFVKFIFYYRSKEQLQAENIMPLTNNSLPIKSIEPYRLQNDPLTHDHDALRFKRHSGSLLDDASPMSMKRSRYNSPEDIPILHAPDLYSSQGSSTLNLSQSSLMKATPGSSPEIHVLEEQLAEMMEQTRVIEARIAAKKAQRAAAEAHAEVEAHAQAAQVQAHVQAQVQLTPPGTMAAVTSLPPSSAFFKRDEDYYGLPSIPPGQRWQ